MARHASVADCRYSARLRTCDERCGISGETTRAEPMARMSSSASFLHPMERLNQLVDTATTTGGPMRACSDTHRLLRIWILSSESVSSGRVGSWAGKDVRCRCSDGGASSRIGIARAGRNCARCVEARGTGSAGHPPLFRSALSVFTSGQL